MKKSLISVALLATTLATGTPAKADHTHAYHRPHAVTLWWVIFNEPDACMANPGAEEQCGPADVFGPQFLQSIADGAPDPTLIAPNVNAGLAVLHATGGVTERRSGKVRLTATLYRSADQPLEFTGNQVLDPMGLGTAYVNPDAEVHLVVRDHGRAYRHATVAQVTNFLEPWCSDPLLGFEGGRNTCQDIQAAVFAPGEAGRDEVYRLADGARVRGAFAHLFRAGDAIQAVVETRVRDRRYRNRYR